MRVLIIKLTSMGDLMHALPALTDASKKIPNIEFDWVVDESFSEVPLWHPNVKSVITTNHRSWKKNFLSAGLIKELRSIKSSLNNTNYDAVIDMQNNLKSAALSYLVNGYVHGLDKDSAREYPSHIAYKFKYEVSKANHAISRQRQLLAFSLNYEFDCKEMDYGILKNKFEKPDFELPNKFLFLVHNASWPTKMWSISKWQEMVKLINSKGYKAILPSGSIEEFKRAQEIASISSDAIAIQTQSLNKTAFIIENAAGCICSDTGLAHLSALLGRPSVTLYSVTDKELIGTRGNNQTHIISPNSKMDSITPQKAWDELHLLIESGGG
ncbi:MAG: lipopolysaccharide heptosyltransferase I [Gammaproteobacteria bacterium]